MKESFNRNRVIGGCNMQEDMLSLLLAFLDKNVAIKGDKKSKIIINSTFF